MVPSFSAGTLSAVSASGARPEALSPTTCLVFGSHRIANRSPPNPFAVGSIRPRQAFIAIAASTALPPCLSISSPAWTASGWAAHTMPWAPYTTERVAAPRPAAPALARLMSSASATSGGAMRRMRDMGSPPGARRRVSSREA